MCVTVPDSRRKGKRGKPSGTTSKVKHFEPSEIDILLAQIYGHFGNHYGDLFLFLAYTGVRISEAFALTWDDIDFKRELIWINKRCYQGKIDEPKSQSSNRSIDMFLPVKMMLERRRGEMGRFYAKNPKHASLNLLFPNRDAKYRDYHNTRKIFAAGVKMAGLDPTLSLHCLRHSFVSLLFSRTQNILYASRQLGHAKPDITLRIYSHLLKEDSEDIKRTINEGFCNFLQPTGANGRQKEITA